jgi:hypothetical protein
MNHNHAGITHSNGVVECYECGELIVPESLKELYSGPGYQGRIVIKKEDLCKGQQSAA